MANAHPLDTDAGGAHAAGGVSLGGTHEGGHAAMRGNAEKVHAVCVAGWFVGA